MAVESKFLNGAEGSNHLISLARYNFSSFRHKQIVKIWPGQYFAVYRYDDCGVDPIIQAKIKILGFTLSEEGLCCQMIDCKTNTLYRVGNVPTLACGYEVGVAIPQRVSLERTIKQVGSATHYGLAAGMLVMHRKDPDNTDFDVDLLSDWYFLKSRFTDDGAWCKAIESYERRT